MSATLFFIGSILYAIPSCMAAYYGRKNSKQLKTANGKSIAEMVEITHQQNQVLLRRSTDVKPISQTENS